MSSYNTYALIGSDSYVSNLLPNDSGKIICTILTTCTSFELLPKKKKRNVSIDPITSPECLLWKSNTLCVLRKSRIYYML